MARTSKEYAVALFSLAKEKGCEDELFSGLNLIKSVFDQTPYLYSFLKSPGISKQSKLDIIKEAFENDLPEYALSFLMLLCEHGDIIILGECTDEFERIYNEDKRMGYACVTSAVELTDAQKDALLKKLTQKSGKQLKIEYKLDSSLIGGLRIEFDGNVIDGSLKHRLETFKEVMGE